jgi:hypothetical protein
MTLAQGVNGGDGSAALYYDGDQTTTTLTLAQPAVAVTAGTTVNLSAALSASSGIPISYATGSVGFEMGGQALPGCAAVSLISASASCSYTFASTGSFSITATYTGDSNFTGATSSAISELVTQYDATFGYTGQTQQWVDPGGVTTATFVAAGAQGQAGCSSGGLGGVAEVTMSVTPGQTFLLTTGGQNGYNGGGAGGSSAGSCAHPGGGGGASFVQYLNSNPWLAVGSGGGGGSDQPGGAGGGTTGATGTSAGTATGGTGGTQSTWGDGGTGDSPSANGEQGFQGAGGSGGSETSTGDGGGGGGGGSYGGGGGGGSATGGAGGGGGSTYGAAGSLSFPGIQSGDGEIGVFFNAPNVLNVTVNASQTYGGATTYAPQFSGFINNDNPSDLDGNLSCSSVSDTAPVGTQPLSGCGGYISDTYYILYTDESLTVNPAPLGVSVSGTQPYAEPPAFTPSYSGFVLGQNQSVVTGTLSCSTNAVQLSPPGPGYTVSDCSGLTSPNYQLNYSYSTLDVVVAPTIISASSAHFMVGNSGTFLIQTSPGYPIALTLHESGNLPSGLTFTDNGNGTATLQGTPAVGSGGQYTLTITADNGISPAAQQSLIVDVYEAPGFQSASSTTFTTGTSGSFTVATSTLYPSPPTIERSGSLPSGVTFVDNGDGTGTLAGTPAAGSGGTYSLTFTASNGIDPNATQSFTLTVDEPSTITSSSTANAKVGISSSFEVTTSHAWPTPTLSENGALPAGVTFVDNGNGTASIVGQPHIGSGGVYTFAITSANGVGTAPVQSFTLTVTETPQVTTPAATTFVVGKRSSFSIVTASAYPAATSVTEIGRLPKGISFTDNGNGTANLSGAPASGSGGAYPFAVIASNGINPATVQSFVLTIDQGSSFTSVASATFQAGQTNSFAVTTANGYPLGALSVSGALPSGVTFTDNGDGSGVLSGTPAATSVGTYRPVLTVASASGSATQHFTLTVVLPPKQPLWLAATDGGVFALGNAGFFGSMGGQPLNQPMVASTATPNGKGYWLVAADGGVFTFGNAGYYGSTGALALTKPVVGMAPTADGKGYWLVAADGGVFAFGDAGFYGSMGGTTIDSPVVGMATTPDGKGYWLVASDGGVFAFGDAGFYGSMGAKPLNGRVVGVAAAPNGKGYFLVAADGGVFTFGDARFQGSA